ncbi:MAG: hypothetical protein AMXMBFR82_08420 [Candidatus Hydrogenedentota bacterium]
MGWTRNIAKPRLLASIVAAMALAAGAYGGGAMEWYKLPEGAETRWSSFENPDGARGAGGAENAGAKGAAFAPLPAGESVILMQAEGSGSIHRMWFTLRERQPQMLRALKLEMFWDGASTPAVSVPLGDFFGAILGRPVAMENELFANPEGRSFNMYIPMPFKRGAKVVLTNESDRDVEKFFYDINYVLTPEPDESDLYFHAYWRRERWTTLMQDFEILPAVNGAGRFLGAHLGVILHPDNLGWWGEGEVKMYLDGDRDLPTIVGTGTEDYIGTGWGQGEFQRRYQGSLIADGEHGQYAFYRYHIPDPVYFHKNIRVTIQQMGGASKKEVMALLNKGVEIKPVSLDYDGKFIKLFEQDHEVDIRKHEAPDDAWTNMYRRDDWSAVAFFYLDKPENGLPPLAPVDARTEALLEEE